MKKKVVYGGLIVLAIACLLFLGSIISQQLEMSAKTNEGIRFWYSLWRVLGLASFFTGMSGIFIMVIGYALEEKRE